LGGTGAQLGRGGDQRSARIEAHAPLILGMVENTPDVTLAKDVEATIESSVTWLYIASVKLMSRRLAAA
jgi:hypothetical protein